MPKVEDVLEKKQIPTYSPIAAIRYCSMRDFTMDEQLDMLGGLVPTHCVEDLDPIPLKYAFLYFVQDSVRELSQGKTRVNCETIFLGAVTKANDLLEKNPHIYTKEFRAEEVEASRPTPKSQRHKFVPNKGTKLDKAMGLFEKNKELTVKEFAAVLIKELDMSAAGALTYAYQGKKKLAKLEAK